MLHGTEVTRLALVAVALASANRDERRYEHSDEFHLGRTQPHLAFGSGPHACLSMALARLVAQVGLACLLEQTRQIRPVQDLAGLDWVPSLQLPGPLPLLISVD